VGAQVTEAEREFREFFAAEYGRLRGLGFLLNRHRPGCCAAEARTGPGEPGRMELRLKWFNWCGQGPTRMRWIGPSGPDPGSALPITAPRCVDRSKPSRLTIDHIRR
jgi:hypothetical protein